MNDLLTGGILLSAGTGLVIAMWSKIKAIGWRLLSLFVVRFRVEGWAESSLQSWMWKHCRRSRYGERSYSAGERYVKPEGKNVYVGWESVGRDSVVFWYGLIPILAEIKDVTAGSTHCGSPLVITFLRGTLDPDRLMIAALDEYNQRKHYDVGRYRVQRSCGTLQKARRDGNCEAPKAYTDNTNNFRFLKYPASDIGTPVVDNPFASLALPGDLAVIAQEGRRWLDSEAWYREKNIPWRLGRMFTGPPGCLHPDTPVYDPTDGTSYTVHERCDRAEAFHVYAKDAEGRIVVTAADPPHRYTLAPMMRTTLASGRSFITTPWHRVWDGQEWVTVSCVERRLHAGVAVRLPSISDNDRQVHAQGVLRSTRILQGSQDYYPACPSTCGERLHSEVDSDRELSPSPDDALVRIRCYSHTGDRALVLEYSRSYLSCDPRDRSRYSRPAVPHSAIGWLRRSLREQPLASCYLFPSLARSCSALCPWHTRLPRLRSCLASNFSALYTRCNPGIAGTPQVSSTAASRNARRFPSYSDQPATYQGRLCNRQDQSSPSHSSRVRCTIEDEQVVSVQHEKKEYYYDFHVPIHENYWAVGAFHHNTGKTSSARALAMSLDIPILAPELQTYDDEEFIAFWHSALSQTPCCILLEDIDTVYHGRESVKGGVSFGCLLNCISGAEGADGICVICTTNNLSVVDPALLRPGRCDRTIEFTPLDEPCRRALVSRILSDCPHLIDQTVIDTDGMTGCQVQEKSARIALDWHWRAV